MSLDAAELDEMLNSVRERLLSERNSAGHWSGELSSSALSTATAVFALHELSRLPLSSSRIGGLDQLIKSGVQWLVANQNADGGWGDTIRLPVVSYALPALIAMGQVRHAKRQTLNPLTRMARRLTRRKTLRIARDIQPESGGFLEATPLTSFVVMSLVHAPRTAESEAVIAAGARFLVNSVREDGSWPIDTNLATWVTTLSINALHADPDFQFPENERRRLIDWLLDQQHRTEHLYTHAAPGGWAWTNLSGGVPDADDTAGALIALHHLAKDDPRVRAAAENGVQWLLDLQNKDGGIPTFCRGWTNLPFDRSGADLTAHALAAWRAWEGQLSLLATVKVRNATAKAMKYLEKSQGQNGQWIPLWFGNQATLDDE